MKGTNERKKELFTLMSSITGCEVTERTLVADLPIDCEGDDFAVLFGNLAEINIFSCQSALQSSQTVGEFIEKII